MTDTAKIQNFLLKIAVVAFALLICIGAVHSWQSRGAPSLETRIHVLRFQVESSARSHASSICFLDYPGDLRERLSSCLAVETASRVLQATTRLHDGQARRCAMRFGDMRSRRGRHRAENAARDHARNRRCGCAADRRRARTSNLRAATDAGHRRYRPPSPTAPRLISH